MADRARHLEFVDGTCSCASTGTCSGCCAEEIGHVGTEMVLLVNYKKKLERCSSFSALSWHSQVIGVRGVRPVTKWITSNTIPITNRIQAICVAIAATPESPKTPAINPSAKNTNA